MTKSIQRIGNYRWRILALLFVATTINYMDRSIINVLASTLQYKIFNWTDADYSLITISFQIAYAIGMLTMGGIIDRFGTRIGYVLSIGIWSVFGMLHAAVRPAFGLVGFILARFGLGFGESGNFPAAVKTVAEWFPKKERALATGIFNAGSNIGAILAPLIIPLIVVAATGKNWQWAFLTTGAFSAIWVVLWLTTYKKPEEHPKLSKTELEHINSDSVPETTEKIPWRKVFFVKQAWAFPILKITDAVWWFYLFWAGKFLYDMFGLDMGGLALPLIIIFIMADVGSISGGWLSSFFIKRGWSINKSRKLTMLFCALIILPVMFVTKVQTGFKVSPEGIDKLSKTELKVNNENRKFPAELLSEVKKFEGQEFHAARDFKDTLANSYGKTITAAYIDFIVSNAESGSEGYRITDKTLKAVESNYDLPEELTHALDKINKQKVGKKSKASPEELKTYIRKEVGNAYLDVWEFEIFNKMRTNKLYWIAVLLIALAAGGHQAWAANIFTVVSDVFPKKATASVVGIGGMVGAVAGILASWALGSVLSSSGPSGYFYAFLVAGLLYLVTLGIVHLIMPRMTPLDENLKPVK